MKKLLVLAVGLLACAGVASADDYWSSCPPGQILNIIGTAQTSNGVVSTQGQPIRNVWLNGGSTTFGLLGVYDSSTLGGAVLANLVLELEAGATGFVQSPNDGFYKTPLTTRNGVTLLVQNATVAGVLGCEMP